MSNKSKWVTRYTTAIKDYDWMGTTELGIAGYDAKTRKPWRKVSIDPKYVETQTDRYMSGFKPCIPVAEFNKLLAYGLVVKE